MQFLQLQTQTQPEDNNIHIIIVCIYTPRVDNLEITPINPKYKGPNEGWINGGSKRGTSFGEQHRITLNAACVGLNK